MALASAAYSTDDLPESNLGSTDNPIVAAPEQRLPVIGVSGVDPFLVGDWVGYAEDLFEPLGADGQRPRYVFPSGSSAIYPTLTLGPRQSLNGQVRFGLPDAPVVQAGVPLGVNDYFAEANQFEELPLAPVEGFACALFPAQLRFQVERLEDAIGVTTRDRPLLQTGAPSSPL